MLVPEWEEYGLSLKTSVDFCVTWSSTIYTGFPFADKRGNHEPGRSIFMRLDYISCILTVGSTVLIGKRQWHGWLIAAANSVIICYIGLETKQTGFIPANLFCLGIYSYNIYQWRSATQQPSQHPALSDRLIRRAPRHRNVRDSALRRNRQPTSHEPAIHDRIRARELSARD